VTRGLAATVLVGLVTAAPLAAQSGQTPDPGPILERSSRVYQDLRSLQAAFDQVVDNEMIGRLESHGRLYQQGESLLALRFDDPPEEAIIVDGTYMWVYTPSATPNQVLRIPLPSAPTYGLNVLSWILDKPAERYYASYRKRTTLQDHPVDVIDLAPRDESLPFVQAAVWLDAESGLPRRVTIIERSGTERTFTLRDFIVNDPLPDDTFTFDVPRGVEVVDQG
jgi:outer membrane lipoprotein-sorting protein